MVGKLIADNTAGLSLVAFSWMRSLWLVVLVMLAIARGSDDAEELSTTEPHPAMTETTSTTVVESTTTTVVEASTTSQLPRVTPDRVNRGAGGNDIRRLSEGTVYVMPLDGVTVELSPTMPGWDLLGYSGSRVVLGWNGPARRGTLEAVIYNIDVGGVEEAWERIEGLRDRFFREDLDWEWTWVDEGTGLVGGREAEWREVRIPPVPEGDSGPDDWNAVPVVQSPFPVVLGHDSSARFYVVPIDDQLTVTVLGWESRCMCPPNGLLDRAFVDDFENELSMWIDELEAFLVSMEFVER